VDEAAFGFRDERRCERVVVDEKVGGEGYDYS
jgi:hypothetical protein